mgnify:CR=1 FL=1
MSTELEASSLPRSADRAPAADAGLPRGRSAERGGEVRLDGALRAEEAHRQQDANHVDLRRGCLPRPVLKPRPASPRHPLGDKGDGC